MHIPTTLQQRSMHPPPRCLHRCPHRWPGRRAARLWRWEWDVRPAVGRPRLATRRKSTSEYDDAVVWHTVHVALHNSAVSYVCIEAKIMKCLGVGSLASYTCRSHS